MRIEFLPGTTNVVRFPTERRVKPSLELLRSIAPDVREIGGLAEAFGLAVDGDARDEADAKAAKLIANGRDRASMLDALVAGVVTLGVGACRVAHEAAIEAAEAQEAVLTAQTAGGLGIEQLSQRAERLTDGAARLLVEAYVRAEEAEGVARAVSLARRGEIWSPRDARNDADALFGVRASG